MSRNRGYHKIRLSYSPKSDVMMRLKSGYVPRVDRTSHVTHCEKAEGPDPNPFVCIYYADQVGIRLKKDDTCKGECAIVALRRKES